MNIKIKNRLKKSRIITLQQLQDISACAKDIEFFRQTFGDRVRVTEALAVKYYNKFNWEWAVRLLPPPAWKQYQKATAPAQEQHQKVIASAQDQYQKAIASAREQYQKAIEPAWEQYKKATASGREQYQKVIALAWARVYRGEALMLDKKINRLK